MTQFDTDETEDDEDEGTGLVKDLRKQLRESNKAIKDLQAKAEANSGAAKRVAFIDANIPDNPQTRFFRENYGGELTAEAIRAQASEFGFIADDDHSQELGEIADQSGAALGAEGPATLGSMEEMEAEMDKAARDAPRGRESQAIAQVVAKYQRSV